MQTQNAQTPRTNTTHPLILVAATAVTVASLTAIASLAGWLPGGDDGANAPPAPVAESAPATPEKAAAPSAAAAKGSAAQNGEARPARRSTPAPVAKSTPAPAASPGDGAARGATPVSTNPPRNDSGVYAESSRPPACLDCGTVESVREIKAEGQGSGLGAVAGGVLGGLVGNQFGKGGGNKALTVAGAVGGAFAGHEVEKNVRGNTQYQVTVRLDDGSTQTITLPSPPPWRGGDRVRVRDGQLVGL